MSQNIDVLNLDKIELNPYCNHGPTIVFTNGKKSFYACSACRDHKLCNFYLEFDENKAIPAEKLKTWRDRYSTHLTSYPEQKKIREDVQKLSQEKRKYCQSCNQFILDPKKTAKKIDHSKHLVKTGITDQMLKEPIKKILDPVELNSSNAQFVFDWQTNNFILEHIKKFNYDSVLCVGVPSVFENLKSLGINRFLLDIDQRFMSFYDNDQFQKYNMFNNHFFYDKQAYLKFLNKSENLLLIIDPPYGGIVRLTSNTIESIKKDFGKENFSTLLFYPYFMENWINKWLPGYNMLDYKVSYGNQKKFSQNSNLKKGSPARIFTNLPLDKIELPASEGYKFCDKCNKFTFEENLHCDKCSTCPSKDGFFYKHCESCKRCVKSSFIHCKKCQKCHLESSNICESSNSEIIKKPYKRKLEQQPSNHKNKIKKNK